MLDIWTIIGVLAGIC